MEITIEPSKIKKRADEIQLILDKYIEENDWISVEKEIPKNGQTVYVLNKHGKSLNQTIAIFYKKHTMLSEDVFEDCSDSDIFNDLEYVREGFYECPISDENLYLLLNVVKWKPLFKK